MANGTCSHEYKRWNSSMKQVQKTTDILIIGTGFGGLSMAILLSSNMERMRLDH